MEEFVCEVCGYVYDPEYGEPADGVSEGTQFEEVPASWRCPICGAEKDRFEPL